MASSTLEAEAPRTLGELLDLDRARFCRAHPHAFLVPAIGLRKGRRTPALRTDALHHRVFAVRAEGGPWAPVLVGRSAECDVVIDDPRVSRHHATFERTEPTGEYAVLDAGSRNGVRVDSVPLSPWSLVRVDSLARLSFGGVEMLFVTAPDLFDLTAALAARRRSR